jgi:hypothetical protein
MRREWSEYGEHDGRGPPISWAINTPNTFTSKSKRSSSHMSRAGSSSGLAFRWARR